MTEVQVWYTAGCQGWVGVICDSPVGEHVSDVVCGLLVSVGFYEPVGGMKRAMARRGRLRGMRSQRPPSGTAHKGRDRSAGSDSRACVLDLP